MPALDAYGKKFCLYRLNRGTVQREGAQGIGPMLGAENRECCEERLLPPGKKSLGPLSALLVSRQVQREHDRRGERGGEPAVQEGLAPVAGLQEANP